MSDLGKYNVPSNLDAALGPNAENINRSTTSWDKRIRVIEFKLSR